MQELDRVICIFNRYIVAFYLLSLQMDVTAVKDSTDEDLYKLGMRAKGDILALRGYCSRMNLISNISDKLARKKNSFGMH